jgi:hypothetical protein
VTEHKKMFECDYRWRFGLVIGFIGRFIISICHPIIPPIQMQNLYSYKYEAMKRCDYNADGVDSMK